jgi:hypothetical protein
VSVTGLLLIAAHPDSVIRAASVEIDIKLFIFFIISSFEKGILL